MGDGAGRFDCRLRGGDDVVGGRGELELSGGVPRHPEADVDNGGVVDQVEALDLHRADLPAQGALQVGDERGLVGDRVVEDDHLMAVAAHERGVVTDPQGRDDGAHEGRHHPDRRGLDPAEQAQGQGREEVGHLVLGQLGGAQTEDGQDAEEPQAQAGRDARRRQQQGDGQDAHVDADIGGHEVLARVAWGVERPDQDSEGDQVGGDVGQGGQAHREAPVGSFGPVTGPDRGVAAGVSPQRAAVPCGSVR